MTERAQIQNLLQRGCEILELQIGEDGIAQLVSYCEQLLIWSKKMNLIGKNQDLEQVVENHFLDSLLLLKAMPEPGMLADVGTGAGFPGLVCKAVHPEMELTLIEPRQKRVSFLKHVVRELALPGVLIHACRVEELPEKIVPTYVTSRAVAEIGEFIKMVVPLVADDTSVVCMKGPRWQQELKAAQSQLSREGLHLEEIVSCTLPFSKAERAILTFGRDMANRTDGEMLV